MQTILDMTLDPSSREEFLPDFSPEFPYRSSRVPLGSLGQTLVPWHWHSAVELFYIEEGCLEYTTPAGRVVFPAGSGGFVNTNILHASRPLESDTLQLLHLFDPVFLSGTPDSRIAQKYILPLTTNRSLEILPLLPGVHDGLLSQLQSSFRLDTGSIGYELHLRETLSKIWLELMPLAVSVRSSGAPDSDRPMKAMMVYLYEHYQDAVSVEDLARAGGVSKRGCFRLFRQQLHTTPVEYLRQLRLEKACGLLSGTDKPITEIAYLCGLGSSSYFGKTFRDAFGCTPKAYRARWHDCDTEGQK